MKLWVLTKETEAYRENDPASAKPIFWTDSREGIDVKLARIGKANPQYELTSVGTDVWRIGPGEDEDQGFFGDRVVWLRAYLVEGANHALVSK